MQERFASPVRPPFMLDRCFLLACTLCISLLAHAVPAWFVLHMFLFQRPGSYGLLSLYLPP